MFLPIYFVGRNVLNKKIKLKAKLENGNTKKRVSNNKMVREEMPDVTGKRGR